MEELLAYAILLYEDIVTEEEYQERLDALFLERPDDRTLLDLECETDIQEAVIYIRTQLDGLRLYWPAPGDLWAGFDGKAQGLLYPLHGSPSIWKQNVLPVGEPSRKSSKYGTLLVTLLCGRFPTLE